MAKLLALVFAFFTVSAQAAEFKLNDISEGDLKNIVRELSGNFNHTAVNGAAPLSETYGFEVGLLLGVGATPKLDDLAKRADASTDLAHLPNTALVGVLTIPYAVSFEATFLPKVGTKDLKIQNFALAAKWTMTKVFPAELPVELALKVHTQSVKMESNTTIDGFPSVITFNDKLTGFDVIVSKAFEVCEPYASIGVIQADGELSASGSGTLFNNSFTAGSSASEKSNSIQFTAGSEFKFGTFKLGAEFSRMFDMNRIATKAAFYF